MKRADKLRKEAENTLTKIRGITRHIRNVEDNCLILGEKLILQGHTDLGKQLIEFEYLSLNNPTEEGNKLKLKLAIHHHNSTNLHHPECWGSIKKMPSVYVAEMACDWKSRSQEFGTDLREWIDNYATKKYGFTENDAIYKEIMTFVDLLCEKPFEQIK
jgi:hypothetical protein